MPMIHGSLSADDYAALEALSVKTGKTRAQLVSEATKEMLALAKLEEESK